MQTLIRFFGIIQSKFVCFNLEFWIISDISAVKTLLEPVTDDDLRRYQFELEVGLTIFTAKDFITVHLLVKWLLKGNQSDNSPIECAWKSHNIRTTLSWEIYILRCNRSALISRHAHKLHWFLFHLFCSLLTGRSRRKVCSAFDGMLNYRALKILYKASQNSRLFIRI